MEKQAYKKFGWLIKNFSSLQSDKCYSFPVLISDCKWRLLAYPKGDNCNYFSVFLEVVDFESLPCGWGRYVTLRLTLVNQLSQSRSVVEETKHCFDAKSTSWGFPTILRLTKLHEKDGGFLVNGELMIFAELDVSEVVGTLDAPEKSYLHSMKYCIDGLKSINFLKKTSPAVEESNDVNGTKHESFITRMEKQIGNKFSLSWVIKNFSFSPTEMCHSDLFVIGAFKWYLVVECDLVFLYIYVYIDDSQSLPSKVEKVGLRIVNQLYEKLSILKVSEDCFDDQIPIMGYQIPYEILAEVPGFLVNGELMIVAEIIGASDVFEESIPLRKIAVNGFHVLPSQVKSVKCIFERHPDITLGFRAKNQLLRTTLMNFLLSLIETMYQPLQELSYEDLVEADIAVTYLKDVGFEVEWLEKKLDQLKEKKEKERSCELLVQEMEALFHDLKHKYEVEKAELLAPTTPLSFNDFVPSL